jgi:hypothetical protein
MMKRVFVLLLLCGMAWGQDVPVIEITSYQGRPIVLRDIRSDEIAGVMLQDDISGNRLTTKRNPTIPSYRVDRRGIVHARLKDCSEMSNGFCNGHLWIDGKDFGVRESYWCRKPQTESK